MTNVPIQRPRQLPSLDGLRALAILLVMALHTLLGRNGALHLPRIDYILANGGLGVSIFFVLSGYLITTLLLREHETTGRPPVYSLYLWQTFFLYPQRATPTAPLAWWNTFPSTGFRSSQRGRLVLLHRAAVAASARCLPAQDEVARDGTSPLTSSRFANIFVYG